MFDLVKAWGEILKNFAALINAALINAAMFDLVKAWGEILKSFAALINAAIGLATLVTLGWGVISYFHNLTDDVSLLKASVATMQQQITEIRRLFEPTKGDAK